VDREKVLDCFRNELRRRGLGMEETEFEGITAYSAGPGRPHLAWVDRETLLVGDRGNVEKMIRLDKGGGRSVRSNTPLIKLYERVADGHDVAIAAIPGEAVSKRLGSFVPEEWRPAVEAEQIGIGARMMKGMDLFVTLRLRSGLEAEKLRTRLERDLERWQDHDYVVIAGLSSHMKAIRLEGAGPEITVRADWTDKQVDTLARLALDSAEEIMRDGADSAAKNIRDRLRPSKSPRDGGPSAGGDGSPTDGSAGDGSAAGDGGSTRNDAAAGGDS
jgi:hypothetical protein